MKNGGEGNEKEVKKEAGEQKQDENQKVEERASEIAAKKLEQQAAEKAIRVYENLNARYKDDPAFREEFDRIWAGVKNENASTESNDDDDELEPIDQLRKELLETKDTLSKATKEIENLRNVYGYDKLSGRREGINARYENDFRKLASDVGYDPGSDAYETLYADVLREGRTLARKFGLVTEDGNVDPLKEYSPEFLKEAFGNAYDRHKRAGFADAWERKKRADGEKRNEVQDELSPYFDPKKIKTPEGRAAALEKAFRHKFGNMKIV